MSVVYRKTEVDGSAPLFFMVMARRHFDPANFFCQPPPLLDRGLFVIGIFAAAVSWANPGARGSHDEQDNTFTDFIACAEHLIHDKYTSKNRMYSGGAAPAAC
jgi:oligopeptidase B